MRRRQEDEELQRVLELSKQDKGGRNAYAPYQPSAPGAGSSSGAAATGGSSSAANAHANAYPSVTSHHAQQPATSQPLPPPPQEPEPVLDLSTATRVRALYTFTSAEVGELNFERGDVIKVLDRGFKEWWRGACNGKIGVSGVSLRLPLTCPGMTNESSRSSLSPTSRRSPSRPHVSSKKKHKRKRGCSPHLVSRPQNHLPVPP